MVAQTTLPEADFDTLSWHDNEVQAMAWEPLAPGNPGRPLLGIDYIVKWAAPEAPSSNVSFWVSPATLVFDPAWDLTADIDRTGWAFQLSLGAIRRAGPDERGNSIWTLEGDGFTISLGAPGFTQYLRRPPVRSRGPVLSADERGGFSFDRRGYLEQD